MYNLRIVSPDGSELRLGRAQSAYRLTEINGMDALPVKITSSQGFGQVGVTHSALALEARAIDITGTIDNFTGAQLRKLSRAFLPLTSVRVYFEDRYFLDCTVKESIKFSPDLRRMLFNVALEAAYPYWRKAEETSCRLGGLVGGFTFPAELDTHQYADFSDSLFLNCVNGGDAETDFAAEITARSGTCSGITILNVETREYLKIDDSVSASSRISVFRENGLLRVIKTENGADSDIFSKLDENSSLFSLHVGDTVLRASSEEGDDSLLMVSVRYYETVTGVHYGL